MNGGYIMIEANGLDISSTAAQTISGIGEAIVNARKAGKPIVISGMKSGGDDISPTFATLTGNILTFNGNSVTVGDNDSVTVAPYTGYGLALDVSPASGSTLDLDDLKAVGKYRINSATEAARVTHAPFTDRGYSVTVEYISNTNYILQTLIPANNANTADAVYRRHFRATGTGAATGWSSWYLYAGEIPT